ncbi:MAG TPA: 1-acyl-sn-glycerol-3-phosphate acyltransferase [Thermoanaerobaculia bacterium]
MWLLPILTPFARVAVRAFYALEIAGEAIPRTGPLLLVANHPNMGVDGGLLIAAARRPVRFLAKAPLFASLAGGIAFRGVGAIPVYRRHDDPSAVSRNDETFRAAREALLAGSAIGLFPEGISHSKPSLAPMRTGAARIALDTARALGRPFPIVAVGMTYRAKTRFRSKALALVAGAVPWDDLAGRDDSGAVRELTRRIERAIRDATVNLETWEDAPAVLAAESIWAAEHGLPRDAESRLERTRDIAKMLARLRERNVPDLLRLEEAVLSFDRFLRQIGVSATALEMTSRSSVALRWLALRLPLFALAAPLLLAGRILFFVPYRATDRLARRIKGPEMRATVKILGGTAIYLLWNLALAIAAGIAWGAGAGIAAFFVLALLAGGALVGMQWWGRAQFEARNFLLLRRRETLRQRLLARRRHLAAQLDELRKDATGEK